MLPGPSPRPRTRPEGAADTSERPLPAPPSQTGDGRAPTPPPGAARAVRGLAGAVVGAIAARGMYAALTSGWGPGSGSGPVGARWNRVNFRGERVTLLEGPALAAGACTGTVLSPGLPVNLRMATVLAGGGAAAFGAYDDLSGTAGSRGFRGHLGALARGEVTTGAAKILGIGATSAAAAVAVARAPVDVLVNSALIAGSANLLNLFDLRPGRATKVALLVGAPALAHPVAGPIAAPALGAAAALLPEDLGERAMLGDSGANALGAMLGVAAAASLPRSARLGLLAGVVALTAASEFVSFTRVIAETPPLRRLDELGRRSTPFPAGHRPLPADLLAAPSAE